MIFCYGFFIPWDGKSPSFTTKLGEILLDCFSSHPTFANPSIFFSLFMELWMHDSGQISLRPFTTGWSPLSPLSSWHTGWLVFTSATNRCTLSSRMVFLAGKSTLIFYRKLIFWVVVSNVFLMFNLTWGNQSNLTIICFKWVGWNPQLVFQGRQNSTSKDCGRKSNS